MISILSLVIWTIIPFRQWKQNYFKYFTILAMVDIVTNVLRKFFNSNTNSVYTIISLLLVYSLVGNKFIKKYKYILTTCLGLTIYLSIYTLNNINNLVLFSILHFIIIAILLKYFITKIVRTNILNIFTLILLLYEISVVTKIVNLITGFADAYTYFYLTTAFEILIGIFFIIFKEDDPRIVFKIR